MSWMRRLAAFEDLGFLIGQDGRRKRDAGSLGLAPRTRRPDPTRAAILLG